MKKAIKLASKKTSSRYIALDLSNQNKILAEGTKPDTVAKQAGKTGRPFSIMYVPKPGKTYIY